uniref:Regulator of G-protein signaling rgs-7 n=2 Tax=Ascaris TaxID=6251 RepID=F1KVV1_ASCSU
MCDVYGGIKPRTTLNLHKFNERKRGRDDEKERETLMNLSSDIDDDGYTDDELESPSDITSDSDFCRPMPVARGADRHWNTKGFERRSRRSHVPCGIGARARLRFGSLSTIAPVDHSSSLETTNDDDELCDLYAAVSKKHRSPPRLLKGLSMIEELSPIGDPGDIDIPKVPSLQLSRNWRPLQTSTTTSVHHIGVPKTNPRHAKCTQAASSTPRIAIGVRNSVLSHNVAVYDALERPLSFFEETPSKDWSRPASEALSSGYIANWKPDHFGLPAPFARRIGCKGKLHLTMSLSGRYLIVSVVKAVFFLDPYQSQASSYVRVELKRNPRYNKRMRSSSEDRYCQCDREQSFRTRLVPLNNHPLFYENFTFELHRRNYQNHDLIGISVWITNADNTSRKRMLGCMAFPVRRLIKKANMMSEVVFDENMHTFERTVINDGDFFLLRPELGEKQNFPECKINVQKYYDDIGTNSSGSQTHSPPKIMRDSGWSSHEPLAASSSSGCHPFSVGGFDVASGGYGPTSAYSLHAYGGEYSSSSGGTGSFGYLAPLHSIGNRISSKVPLSVRLNNFDYTTESSSVNSTNPFYSANTNRPTLPSITTTSDGTSDISSGVSMQLRHIDFKYLYAEGKNEENRSQRKEESGNGLRRVASFTFSPKGTEAKHNKRLELDVEPKKKSTFSRFTKTLSYIRNKMDAASTSALYPTKEEVRQWEQSFESLLNHKYGCLLFRTFLKGEFSDENVDFWLECEEFKKMKEGKKATTQRAYAIYNEYIAEQSPKEVNLDSDTRAATKAALESGAKPNMFTLAQGRIEQLMAKDSYRRFLKSKMFLDLLNDGGTNTSSSDATLQVEITST